MTRRASARGAYGRRRLQRTERKPRPIAVHEDLDRASQLHGSLDQRLRRADPRCSAESPGGAAARRTTGRCTSCGRATRTPRPGRRSRPCGPRAPRSRRAAGSGRCLEADPRCSASKTITSSMRFKNSGESVLRTSPMTSSRRSLNCWLALRALESELPGGPRDVLRADVGRHDHDGVHVGTQHRQTRRRGYAHGRGLAMELQHAVFGPTAPGSSPVRKTPEAIRLASSSTPATAAITATTRDRAAPGRRCAAGLPSRSPAESPRAPGRSPPRRR